MKKKQSKKRWAWTEAQKRKHWSANVAWRYWSSPPKWYCRTFDVKRKNKCKRALRKVKLGYDPENLEYETDNHRHIATWWYN